MSKRLYQASTSIPARTIMFASPEQALGWLLEAITRLTAEVQSNMTREQFVPIGDEKPPTLILSFDVMGVPAPKETEKINGQQIV